MNKDNSTINYINDIYNTLKISSCNYNIWRVYKKYKGIYSDLKNKYPFFFTTSYDAHYQLTIILLYRLFEKRSDTVNFHSLLDNLKNQVDISDKTIKHIEDEFKLIKPYWLKISILRNSLIGHRTNNFHRNPKSEAKLSSPNIQKLIKRYEILFNYILSKYGKKNIKIRKYSREDTLKLLKNLNRINKL